MNVDEKQIIQIRELSALWNKVELRAKVAEQFNGKTVAAAINEMRYGGRRFVDAVEMMFRECVLTDREKEQLSENLYAAKSALINADHDITDSICFVVIKKVNRTIEKHGIEKIRGLIHDFDVGYQTLKDVKQIVQESRETRSLRSANYDKIAKDHLEKLTALHTEISQQKELFTFDDAGEQYRGIRAMQRLLTIIAVVGSAASVVGVISAFWMWCNPCS